MTKEEYGKEISEKFDDKLSISFWSVILWESLKNKAITEEEVFELLLEVNKNNT